MKLDITNKKLLYHLHQNARMPDSRLGKLLSKSKESIKYRINQLEKHNIILGHTLFIDPAKIGYSSGKVYFKLINNPSRKKELITELKKDPRLFWLGTGDGAYNIGLTFMVRTQEEFFEIKNNLYATFHDIILEMKTGVLVSVLVGDRAILIPELGKEWMQIWKQTEIEKIDDTDRALLKELLTNSRTSLVALHQKLDLSIEGIRQRMKRLEKKGIIKRYMTSINHKKIGYDFYKTFITFKGIASSDEEQFIEFVRSIPNIAHLVKQISPWDFELETFCTNYEEYLQIMNSITAQFTNILKIDTTLMDEDYVFPAMRLDKL